MKHLNLLSFLKVASAAFFFACTPAMAQWQVPDHSVPIGRGAGTGFKFAAPSTAGEALVSNGGSSDPSFGPTSSLTAATLKGIDSAVAPSLNSSAFLSLVNTNAAFLSGVQYQFGAVAGSPFAMLSSQLTSGPSPYMGRLVFSIKPNTASPLQNVLYLTETGSLQSTDESHINVVGGFSSFGAFNTKGAQAFSGYSATSLSLGGNTTAGGYFVGENDQSCTPGCPDGAWGAYIEGRGGNGGQAWGLEVDVQNTSGFPPQSVDPNNLFSGTPTGGPVSIAIVSQSEGSKIGPTVQDASAWAYIVESGGHKYQKGLVFGKNSIASVGGHMVAVAMASSQEITWWDATGANIGRLVSDGFNPFWNSQLIPTTTNGVSGQLAVYTSASHIAPFALGAGVSTSLQNALNATNGLVGFNGALGTPTSGVGTNLTGLNASNLSSGTVAAARGGAGTINGALKGNGSGVVSQAASIDLSDSGAWAAFTPSPVCSTQGGGAHATFTVTSARFKTIMGKTTFVELDITVTAANTDSGALNIQLPNTPNSAGSMAGREVAILGNATVGNIDAGSATVGFVNGGSAAGLCQTGARIKVSSVYENQ